MFTQFILVDVSLIRQSGNIEMIIQYRPNSCHSFSICHWNLDSLTVHNYLKVPLLWTCIAIKKFGVVSLSETYLDLSNLPDNDNFNLPEYGVIRADHPSNTKKVVFVSISKTLLLKVLDIQ